MPRPRFGYWREPLQVPLHVPPVKVPVSDRRSPANVAVNVYRASTITANCRVLPVIVTLTVWFTTCTAGMLMTNSWNPPAFRRSKPVHCTDAGRLAAQPAPLVMVPAQLPNTGSPAA